MESVVRVLAQTPSFAIIVLTGCINIVVDFKCRNCLNLTVANDDDKKVRLGNVEYEVVDKFCNLGHMLSACGGADASSISLIRSGWKKFRELFPLLTSPLFSHKTKRKLYSACIRSDMLHGSKTWPLKETDNSNIAQTDMQMVWQMCHVSLRDKKSSEKLQNRLAIASITDVLHQTKLS